MPLDRLDEATTATLAARLCAEETMDPKLAARLWSETEGNPLFVIEALRAGPLSGVTGRISEPTLPPASSSWSNLFCNSDFSSRRRLLPVSSVSIMAIFSISSAVVSSSFFRMSICSALMLLSSLKVFSNSCLCWSVVRCPADSWLGNHIARQSCILRLCSHMGAKPVLLGRYYPIRCLAVERSLDS